MSVFANLGGEEGPIRPPPLARHAGALFGLLFAADDAVARGDWPDALAPAPGAPAFSWLDDGALHAWLNSAEARERAQAEGLPLAGPAPEVVARVHDKAFAREVARAQGYEARSLRGLASVWDPDALLADDAAPRIHDEIRAWPDWTGKRFTLKPRLGGSGRGRFGGDAATPLSEIATALPRLATRGGAVLEPWVERTSDLSTQLHVARDGTVTLLGTLTLHVSASGVYRGHAGRLDHRHRVTSGHARDADLLEAAIAVAAAAHSEGFHGPCGVDAFTFQGESGEELRAVCELNARFTLGTVAIGVLRRARRRIEARLGPPPGRRLAFEFTLDARGEQRAAAGELLLPLAPGADGLCAALRVRSEAEAPEPA